jgi:hypothetical protein
MTRTNLGLYLGFGVLVSISLTLAPTPATAQGCNLGSKDCVCPGYGRCFYKTGSRNWCEQKGAPYRYDPQTGSCMKTISKKAPVTSGGAGGGGSAQDDCEAKGANYRYDPQYGCMKTISKKTPVTSGGAGGGE